MEFGLIPRDWFQIDEKAKAGRKKMEDEHVMYGGGLTLIVPGKTKLTITEIQVVLENRESFHLFFREENISPSSRPDVRFHCDISFDPFLFMEDDNKICCEHNMARLVF